MFRGMVRGVVSAVMAAAIFVAGIAGAASANAEVTAEKAEIYAQMGHSGGAQSVAFSPDGRTIVSGSMDKTLKLWDVASGRELRTLIGHSGFVMSVAFSPDGRTIASCGFGMMSDIKFWDAASGRELRTIENSGMVRAIAFSPDGRTIVSGGSSSSFLGGGGATLKLWDVASGRELKALVKPDRSADASSFHAVAFSPDGRTIISGGEDNVLKEGSDNTLKLWDAASGRELKTIGHYGKVNSVAFSPDGRTIVSGSGDNIISASGGIAKRGNTLKLWDAASGRELRILAGHKGNVMSVAFSPDGHTIMSSDDNHTIKLWDAADGRELKTLGGGGVMAFSPDGRTIVSGISDIDLWDAASVQKLRTLSGVGSVINGAAFSPDGHTIVSAQNHTINLWDTASGIKRQTLGKINRQTQIEMSFIAGENAVAFSPDGRVIASIYMDHVKLWDAASGQELQKLKENWVSAIAFSSDSRIIATIRGIQARDSSVKLWDTTSGQELQTLLDPDVSNLQDMAFSPDGRTIITSGTSYTELGGIRVWDIASGQKLPSKIKHGHVSHSVAFSPDGRTIATSGSNPGFLQSMHGGFTSDKNIKLWDAASGQELRALTHRNGTAAFLANQYENSKADAFVPLYLIFSPDGRTLASAHNDTVVLWDVTSGQELHTLSGRGLKVAAVDFSKDGKYVIYGSADGAVHQFDAKTGKEMVKFSIFKDGEWLAITPDGYYNASANGHKHLNVRMGNKVYGIDQFYDVFYRPDIVQTKLAGKDISSLVTLTIDDAIKSPPPSVAFTTAPQNTGQPKTKVCYKATSTGGGIGEVRLFQNGKLVKSDGFYRETVAKATDEKIKLASLDSASIQRDLRNLKVVQLAVSPIASNDKGNEFEECQELETMPGENEISVTAFNATNTIQSNMEAVRFTSDRKPEEPHLYVLGVGIDKYGDPSATLKYAVKDADDFRAMMRRKAAGLYQPQNIHIEGLSDSAATKEGIQQAIQAISAKVKPWDSFILFVASHGVLLENQYYIVTAEYNGSVNPVNMISSNEIVGMSKSIKSLSQLFIFDTCHAGGVDNLISGLYDARMSVMAKKMGLHIYASAGSTQTALDGYQGNGLFTHTLLKSMAEAKTTDSNHNEEVSVVELGHQARQDTMDISKKLGDIQSPNIINFGRDNALFRVQEVAPQPVQQVTQAQPEAALPAANDPAKSSQRSGEEQHPGKKHGVGKDEIIQGER